MGVFCFLDQVKRVVIDTMMNWVKQLVISSIFIFDYLL